jgi:hypothetical protein
MFQGAGLFKKYMVHYALLVAGLIKDTFHLTDRHIPVTMYISCMFAHRYVQMKPETIPPKEQGKTY